MPYIERTKREPFDYIINQLPIMSTKGELEYVVFKIMKKYMVTRQFKYSELHDTVYAVMHCADEFRRLNLDVRENEARQTNGDIL